MRTLCAGGTWGGISHKNVITLCGRIESDTILVRTHLSEAYSLLVSMYARTMLHNMYTPMPTRV